MSQTQPTPHQPPSQPSPQPGSSDDTGFAPDDELRDEVGEGEVVEPTSPAVEPGASGLAGYAPGTEIVLTADAAAAGSRLDVFLARTFPEQSRSFLARSIDKGGVRVDGVVARASL
jgi:hypothetical protein